MDTRHPPPATLGLLQGPALTPVSFVRDMVRAYAARGMDPANALKVAQIAPSLLANTTGCITAAQMEAVSGAAMRELDDEALGWFARPLPWGSYGMLARASLSSSHLEVALKRWCRHHGLLTRDVTLSLEVVGHEAVIALEEHRPPGGDGSLRELCHVSLLRNIHGLGCWLIDSRIPLRSASFGFAAPPHGSAYRVLFDGPCTFGQTHSAIRFDARYLALPIQRDESALNLMLQRALPIQVRPYRRDRLLVQRVRHLLLAQAEHTRNAEDLAALINTSARSLHRQLKAEGATLQALKDEVRRERAMAMLQRTDKPVKQVAAAAGFLNEKSFIRAFKSWTGQSPARWRSATGVPGDPGPLTWP